MKLTRFAGLLAVGGMAIGVGTYALARAQAAQQSPATQGAAPAPAHAHGAAADPAFALPPIMPRDEEVALAESAGPSSVVREAAIYVLERGKGYTLARAGTNGFTCIVNRERADTLEPECFDPEGTASILPVQMERARLREEGMNRDDVIKRINEGFASGKFHAPRRAGITYMLYKANRVNAGPRVITYPAHVMIFAPYLRNSDIGADMKDTWMPWVLNEGTPHAYIIVRTGSTPPPAPKP